MNEARKQFRPLVLLFSAIYLLALLSSLYTRMYYGEYTTRELSQEIYLQAVEQDEPTRWLTQYHEEVFAGLDALWAQSASGQEYDRALLVELSSKALVLNRLVRSFTQIDQLNEAWERETKLAQRAARRAHKADNSAEIAGAYARLTAPEYGNYQPFDDLVMWNQAYVWLIFVLFCGVCARVYTAEYASGMYALIYVQALHPGSIARRKICALYAYLFGGITLMYIAELGIAVYMAGSWRELLQPAQALSCMMTSQIPISVLQVILCQYGASLCLGVFVGGVMLILSTFVRGTMNALWAGAAALVLPQALIQLTPRLKTLDIRGYLGVVDMMQYANAAFLWASALLVAAGLALAVWSGVRFARRP